MLGWLVPAENPAGAVYGVLAMGALLAAESGRHETYLDTVLSAMLAGCSYWLLHANSRLLGEQLRGRSRLTLRTLARALAHDRALLRGAAIPLAVIVGAWITGAAQKTAVTEALWSAVACLIAFELLAGVRARARPRELALEGLIGLLLGLGVLGMRVLLH